MRSLPSTLLITATLLIPGLGGCVREKPIPVREVVVVHEKETVFVERKDKDENPTDDIKDAANEIEKGVKNIGNEIEKGVTGDD